jgi:hypothetical protein
MKVKKLEYATIDVKGKKSGQNILDALKAGKKVRVTLSGYITEQTSNWDGVSKEFGVTVTASDFKEE